MKRKLFALLVLSFLLLPLLVLQSEAQTTQGRVAATGRAAGQGGMCLDLQFTILDAVGNPVYGPDVQTAPNCVPVDLDERFFAAVGAGTGGNVPASIFQANATLFISVEPAGGGPVIDTVLINSSGYAHFGQNADLLDGQDSTAFAPTDHTHDASAITSGTLALARIPQGPGSGLNSDLLDGMDSTAFAPAAGSPNYVAKAGDTMTGTLNLPFDGLQLLLFDQLRTFNGNVGIGTPGPVDRLTVVNKGIGGGITLRAGASTFTPEFRISNSAGADIGRLCGILAFGHCAPGALAGDFALQALSSGGSLIFTTGDIPAQRMRITPAGNVFIPTPSSLVMRSPNGVCWQVGVSNGGVMTATSLPCP